MRLIRTVAAVGVLGAATVVVPSASIGHAQESSEFCNTVNLPDFDGMFTSGGFDTVQGRAGETIIARAGPPTRGTPTATTLWINGVVVASDGFPAVVSFTLPADGQYGAIWAVDAGGVVTWDVSCVHCTLTGTPKGDVLVGTEGADVICALGGGDVIDGRGGNDIVLGGDGGDSIRGGGGEDQLFGERGGDAINGRDRSPGDAVFGGPGGDALAGDAGDSLTQ